MKPAVTPIVLILVYVAYYAKALSTSSSRRVCLQRFAGTVVGLGVAMETSCAPAHAVRGAAELDLEYYIRSAVSGNKPEGSVLPSAPPVVPPPRTIREPLRSLWVNDDDCSAACIPTAVLIESVIRTQSDRQGGGSSTPADLERRIQAGVRDVRGRAMSSFAARAQWKTPEVADQYYFDLTSYALWRTAAELLPDPRDRDVFVRQVGRAFYQKLQTQGILLKAPKPQSGEASNGSVVAYIPAITEALQFLTDQGFCKGFRLGDAPIKGQKPSEQLPWFDDLDDEALAGGASIDALVSVFEPATLGASLQITGEQSRFAPDLVGSLLNAVWEGASTANCRGLLVPSWELLFVDPEYRPNPKDYFPNEQLLQFTLTSPSS